MTLLVLAAALRFPGLAVQSLWHDELFSWYASHLSSLREALRFVVAEDVHPPGFMIFMFGVQRLLGDSEVMLRLPSAIAGLIGVIWMYRLGTTLLSRGGALTASALCAVAWTPVYYSQEGRSYIWLFLASIALVERLVSLGRRAEREGRVAVGSALQILLICVALSYLHYFGLLLAALGLAGWGVCAFARAAGRTLWASVVIVLALAYAPWIAALSHHLARGSFWISAPTLARLAGMYDRLTGQRAIVMGGLWGVGLVSALSAARRDGVAPRVWLRRSLTGATGLLLAWATLPALVAVAISLLVRPVVTDRNLIIVLPALLLLTSQAAGSIGRRFRRGRWVAALLVGGLLVDLVVVRDYYTRATKWQYRETADTIIAQTAGQPQPPFVVSGAWHPSYFDYYFAHRQSRVRVGASAIGASAIQAACDKAHATNVWVTSQVRSPASIVEAPPLTGYQRIASWHLVGWRLDHFVKP